MNNKGKKSYIINLSDVEELEKKRKNNKLATLSHSMEIFSILMTLKNMSIWKTSLAQQITFKRLWNQWGFKEEVVFEDEDEDLINPMRRRSKIGAR